MHPVIAPFVAQVGLRLGDFIGVVGEGVVDTAAVDVQILTQVLHGDAGALDMPAGIAHAPGGVPFQCLILKLGFGEPEHKVVLAALVGVLFHALADAYGQILLVEVVEHIVFLQLGGVKVHVAAGKIGVAGVHQPGDNLNVIVNAVGGRLHHIRGADVQLFAVVEKGVGVELGDLHHGLVLPLCALEHLVLALVRVGGQVAHVGDVHHALEIIAGIAQIAVQNVLHNVGAQVADMGKVVHRGAAGVHLYDVGVVGDELLPFSGGGIVKYHVSSLLLNRHP